jgi:hypothetical protein
MISRSSKKEGAKQKIPRIKWRWKHNLPKPLGHNNDSAKRKVYFSLKSETSKINNLMTYLKLLGKQQVQPQSNKWKAEINKREAKWTIQQIKRNKKLVLWKDKPNWQALSRTNQKEEQEDPN